MNPTVMYTIDLDGIIRTHMIYSSAYRTAVPIWQSLSAKYFDDPDRYLTVPADVWGLVHQDSRLPQHHRTCLAMTMDQAVVEHSKFVTMHDHIMQFCMDFELSKWPKCELQNMSGDFLSLSKVRDLMGVCFSIGAGPSDPWFTHDEDTDSMIPYNFRRRQRGRKAHWFVFAGQIDEKPEFGSYLDTPMCPWCGVKYKCNTLDLTEDEALLCKSCSNPFDVKLRRMAPLVATKRIVVKTSEPEKKA